MYDTSQPDTLYLRQKGCEDPRLFFTAEMGRRAKMYGNPCARRFISRRC